MRQYQTSSQRLTNYLEKTKYNVEIIYDFIYDLHMKTSNDLNKHQFAYQTIRSRIVQGIYPPGFRLVIDQLAKEFSSSPIPVREAIRQLESEGLIQYKPYSGAVVKPIDENEYVETLSVLAVIEGYATALAADYMTNHVLKKLTDVNQQMLAAIETYDFISFGDLNRQFHTMTYDYCPNVYLVENIKQTWNRLDAIRPIGSSFNPLRAEASVQEHETIIQMLKDKEPFDRIEQFVRAHKMNTVKAFKERTHRESRF